MGIVELCWVIEDQIGKMNAIFIGDMYVQIDNIQNYFKC